MKASVRRKLALLVTLFLLPARAICEGSDPVDYIYTLDNGSAVITLYQGPGGKVNVPDRLDGNPVTVIGYNSFGNQTGITKLILPEGTTAIEDIAFSGCSVLEDIILPGSLTAIGTRVFSGCISLGSILVPAGVTSISPLAFYTGVMTDIAVDGENAVYEAIDGVLYNKAEKTLHTYPDKKTESEYVVREGTLGIETDAFFTCHNLKSVILPESLTSIGEYAFYSCSDLTALDLPENLAVIESSAFAYCGSLNELVIPKSVTSIGYGASIATDLNAVVLEDGNTTYKTIDGVLFDEARNTLHTYPNKKTAIEYAIPERVSAIGDYAFMHAFSLTDLMIPGSVTSIGQSAFGYCTGLAEIILPDGLERIGSVAFYGCSALTEITIPDSVTEIGYGAFIDCAKVTIYTPAGSYAYQYALDNGIPCVTKTD